MSYWIYLNNKETNKTLPVKLHSEGGTYTIGGNNKAELNVTYNYAKLFNFRSLHGKEARFTIDGLKNKIKEFGIKKDDDYWKCTQGNVGYCLSILLQWAELYPNGVWEVS